jgi:hypothetical protein
LARNPEQHFLFAGSRNAAPVRPDMLGDGTVIGFNGGTFL